MDWQAIVTVAVIIGALFLIIKRGGCCGATKNNKSTRNPKDNQHDEDKKGGCGCSS